MRCKRFLLEGGGIGACVRETETLDEEETYMIEVGIT
jgi:hypothetical protein